MADEPWLENHPSLRRVQGFRTYGTAAWLVTAGMLVLVVTTQFVFAQLRAIDDSLQRVVGPGDGAVSLRPGEHRVFYEHHAVVDDQRIVSPMPPPDVLCTIAFRRDSGLKPIDLSDAPGERYRIPGRRTQGVSIYKFIVADEGRYQVSATLDEDVGKPGRPFVIAIGPSTLDRTSAIVLVGSAGSIIGLILLLAGFTVAVRLYLRRARTARLQTPP